MNERQMQVLQRWRSMGYSVMFAGMRPYGIAAVLMPCKLSDGTLRMQVRANGEYAPIGYWGKEPHHYER